MIRPPAIALSLLLAACAGSPSAPSLADYHGPHGSHLAMYDEPTASFDGLLTFLRDVDAGSL